MFQAALETGKLSNWLRGRPAQPVGGWGCAGLTAPQDLLQRDQAACFVVPAMSATPDSAQLARERTLAFLERKMNPTVESK